jgi:Na+/phosphate symporter
MYIAEILLRLALNITQSILFIPFTKNMSRMTAQLMIHDYAKRMSELSVLCGHE